MTKPKVKSVEILSVSENIYEETFEKRGSEEPIFDYNRRLQKFLSEDKIKYLMIEKGMQIRNAARLIKIPENVLSARISELGLGRKKINKKDFNASDDDKLAKNRDEIDSQEPPIPEVITSICEELSNKISKGELIALTILAYTRPGKKPSEKIIKLLRSSFSKNVGLYLCKLPNQCSKEEIENANYISGALNILKQLNCE